MRHPKSCSLTHGVQLAALLMLLPVGSHASDSKVHSAVFCRVAPTDDAPSTEVLYTGSELQNRGDQAMHVICPVVRDNTVDDDAWQEMRIGVFDRSPFEDISCRAYSRTTGGIIEFDGPFGSTGSLALGWDVIDGPDADDAFDNGYYHLNCKIPARFTCDACACTSGICISGLAFYRIQEP